MAAERALATSKIQSLSLILSLHVSSPEPQQTLFRLKNFLKTWTAKVDMLVKHRPVFAVDLTQIEANGAFSCRQYENATLPNDVSEETYPFSN